MRRKVGASRPKAKVGRRKSHGRRRRRIGASGSMGSLINVIGGLTVGAAGIRWAVTQLGSFIPFLASSPIVDGIFQIAVGYVLPKYIKGPFMQYVGYGIIASGGQTVLVGTGIISGESKVMSYKIGGTSNLRAVGGTGSLSVIGAPGDNRIKNQPHVGNVRAKGFSHYGTGA